MHIDIHKLSHLAHLSLQPDEETHIQEQLEDTLTHIQMLSSIDTTTISPTYQVTNLTNVTREDTSSPSLSQKEALRNASHTKDGYFQVPAIFEKNQ